MPTPFLGEIKLVSFNYAPRGWAFCNGQLLPINQNQALFALLGTTYGGNGQQTFALPNLQNRTVVGMGSGNGLPIVQLGEQLGSANIALSEAQLPAHTHALNVASGTGTLASPIGAHLAAAVNAVGIAYNSSSSSTMPGGVQLTGGSQAHENRQPYLTLNYIIALAGIFPSRN